MSPATAPPHRVLLYCHDGVGIGHTVRSCVLAAALRSRWPDTDVVLAAGSPAVRSFLPAGVRLFPLPAYPILAENLALPVLHELRKRRRQLTDERRRLLLEAVRAFRPHVALVDHMPLGKRDELLPAVLQLRKDGARLLLGFRRIAEDVASTCNLFGYPPVKEALADHFSAVLAYAPPWLQDRFGPLPGIEIAQIPVGFVCRPPPTNAAVARIELGLRADDTVFACGLGGGRGAWPLARSMLLAWSRACPKRGNLLFFLGPMLDPDEEELARLSQSAGIRVIRNSTAFPLGIAAADAVVTTGGYNSVLESLRQGRRLFIVPNQAQEVEQERSAALLADLGLATVIRRGDGLEDSLAEAFAAPPDRQATPRLAEVDFRGDRNTAEIIGCVNPIALAEAG